MFDHPAHKLQMKDLNMCMKTTSEDFWKLEFKFGKMLNITKYISFKYVWLQGFIEQTAGKENEILIVSDHTGRVKVTHCNTVPGGSSWLAKGMHLELPVVLYFSMSGPKL
jgi:hypothetical protein